MKIVQIGPYPISKNCVKGGVESSVYGLTQALMKKHQVYVADYPRMDGCDKIEHDCRLTIFRYVNKGKHNQDAVKRVNDIVDSICLLQPDVVHIHGTGLISYRLYKAFQRKNIQLMLTVHGLLHVEKRNALKRELLLKNLYQYVVQSITEFRILNCANHIIVDTGYVAEQIKQYYKEKKIRSLPQMYVIPQGINEYYCSLRCDLKSNTILSVGSISRRKGHLILLKAFDEVCRQVPDAKLVIAGVLAEQDYYEELQCYIQQSPNASNIQLFVNLPQENLYALYQSASIFALHSQEESQGIVLAEAMAIGLPIIATNVGGIPFVVENRKTGLLSNYGDYDSFANNLIDLLTDYNLCKQLSDNAIKEVNRYMWSHIADEIVRLYKLDGIVKK